MVARSKCGRQRRTLKMGQVKKLLDVVNGLAELDSAWTIFVAEPWTPEAPAVVVTDPDGSIGPRTVGGVQFSYFIEVFIALEFLQGWTSNVATDPTDHAKCDRLIYYAKYDA